MAKFEDEEDITSEDGKRAWKNILDLLKRGEYDLEGVDEYNNKDPSPKEKLKIQQRIASALPGSIDDIPLTLKVGTARYSLPGSKLSLDYLKKEGVCLDNLRMGKSSISQGGNGAFSMNDLPSGSVIAAAPLIPIKRDLLRMSFNYKDQGGGGRNFAQTQQLFSNYCFGHQKSSLLLFPYASSVQFINHENVNPNAYIRWSEKMNREEMLAKDVDDVSSGMVIEFVALRNISIGEEITIDYGREWTMAWHDHVQSWKIDDDSLVINPQSIIESLMNNDEHKSKPIRTIKEQETNPYPKCVRTACYSQQIQSGIWVFKDFEPSLMRFCDIIERSHKEGNYWYTAKMYETELDDGNDEVKHIPHEALFFAQDEYCGDMHLPNAFRHEIGVPEGFYPDKWLDYNDDDDNSELAAMESARDIINLDDGETTIVKCDTTVGHFSMRFRKNWSPIGYERVVELFRRGFYDNSHFFRVIPGFLTQFGMRSVFVFI